MVACSRVSKTLQVWGGWRQKTMGRKRSPQVRWFFTLLPCPCQGRSVLGAGWQMGSRHPNQLPNHVFVKQPLFKSPQSCCHPSKKSSSAHGTTGQAKKTGCPWASSWPRAKGTSLPPVTSSTLKPLYIFKRTPFKGKAAPCRAICIFIWPCSQPLPEASGARVHGPLPTCLELRESSLGSD